MDGGAYFGPGTVVAEAGGQKTDDGKPASGIQPQSCDSDIECFHFPPGVPFD